ncbi:hypothetical protein BSKO_12320 [Bryopsis sp. KO-2023]|nr:hypothetical protein BSKO_12320 [Bryopsis sp. KO-2023]
MSLEDLQAKLQVTENELAQKNAELEERGNLLYKTKTAIEHLQQALAGSQEEEQRLRAEIEQLEESGASRVKELIEELDAEKTQIEEANKRNNELQIHLAEASAALEENQNSNNDLQDNLAQLTAGQADLGNQITQKDADLDECLDKIQELGKEKEFSDALIEELQAKVKMLENDLQALESLSKRDDALSKEEVERLKIENIRQETLKDDAAARVKEVEREKVEAEKTWSKRLTKSEHEWSKKMLSAVHEWSKKLEDSEKEWGARFEESEVRRVQELSKMETSYEERLNELHRLHAQERSDAEVEYTKKIADEKHAQERGHAKELAELNNDHTRRMDELKMVSEKARIDAELHASNEKTVVEKNWSHKLKDAQSEWSAAKAEAERKYNKKLEDFRNRASADKKEMERLWVERFEDAKRVWEKERGAIEKSWGKKVKCLEGDAETRQEEIKEEIEGKLFGLIERLSDMGKREAKREKRRSQLIKQVDEIRANGEEEFRRRCQVERALREAAAIFKKELHDKNVELEFVHDQLKRVKEGSMLRMSLETEREVSPGVSLADRADCGAAPYVLDHSAEGLRINPDENACTSQHENVNEEIDALKTARAEYQKATAAHDKLTKKLVKKLHRKMKVLCKQIVQFRKDSQAWEGKLADFCVSQENERILGECDSVCSSGDELLANPNSHRSSPPRVHRSNAASPPNASEDDEDFAAHQPSTILERVAQDASPTHDHQGRDIEKWQRSVHERLDAAIERLNPLLGHEVEATTPRRSRRKRG